MVEYTPVGIDGDYIIYKDKPLVRNKGMLCYGNMEDDYILFIMVITTKTVDAGSKKVEVPDRVLVQVMSTDESKPSHERLAKQFEKNGLFDALDIGTVWLDKLNKK